MISHKYLKTIHLGGARAAPNPLSLCFGSHIYMPRTLLSPECSVSRSKLLKLRPKHEKHRCIPSHRKQPLWEFERPLSIKFGSIHCCRCFVLNSWSVRQYQAIN